ncbi:uncharacterized protein LOC103696330 isoform X1 [Phoenix dactylifera]|uniref:Uncharacterized protein LOC103696330 isoform X1 n=1 Tax=Phoenix dactylifera TaxID=42345 RepID=A0A8B8IZN5_PHODC|nr:uncharacterized protein LOC103696330 isoform X1 [Phoenix dactylifera]
MDHPPKQEAAAAPTTTNDNSSSSGSAAPKAQALRLSCTKCFDALWFCYYCTRLEDVMTTLLIQFSYNAVFSRASKNFSFCSKEFNANFSVYDAMQILVGSISPDATILQIWRI